ncbi:ABC transporter ATP-binding protein [Rhizobium panacihumi]|uniref:ABC transporter ATP-binding protein n=1 Tax=Rhizobium panacihumi TaxID=2008450 RepID=UPI003D799433
MANATNTKLNSLEVQNLSIRYGSGSIAAVSDVSFSLKGGKLGLVGESGSGKSTVGRAIMRLLPPTARVTADTLLFGQTDLLSASQKELRSLRGSNIALIMQDPRYSLNPVLTIGQQVSETAILHEGLKGAAAWAAARDMLDRVKIRNVDRVMKSYPHQISGGMGQRVMIATMLLAKPGLVIADEPTSALDVSVRGEVLELLDGLVRENGSSLILISHDIRMVSAFCDQIAVMYRGRIVEELSRLSDARHPYTRGLVEAMPDPLNPVRRLKVPDRATFASLQGGH